MENVLDAMRKNFSQKNSDKVLDIFCEKTESKLFKKSIKPVENDKKQKNTECCDFSNPLKEKVEKGEIVIIDNENYLEKSRKTNAKVLKLNKKVEKGEIVIINHKNYLEKSRKTNANVLKLHIEEEKETRQCSQTIKQENKDSDDQERHTDSLLVYESSDEETDLLEDIVKEEIDIKEEIDLVQDQYDSSCSSEPPSNFRNELCSIPKFEDAEDSNLGFADTVGAPQEEEEYDKTVNSNNKQNENYNEDYDKDEENIEDEDYHLEYVINGDYNRKWCDKVRGKACFLCFDDERYKTKDSLIDHIRENHHQAKVKVYGSEPKDGRDKVKKVFHMVKYIVYQLTQPLSVCIECYMVFYSAKGADMHMISHIEGLKEVMPWFHEFRTCCKGNTTYCLQPLIICGEQKCHNQIHRTASSLQRHKTIHSSLYWWNKWNSSQLIKGLKCREPKTYLRSTLSLLDSVEDSSPSAESTSSSNSKIEKVKQHESKKDDISDNPNDITIIKRMGFKRNYSVDVENATVTNVLSEMQQKFCNSTDCGNVNNLNSESNLSMDDSSTDQSKNNGKSIITIGYIDITDEKGKEKETFNELPQTKIKKLKLRNKSKRRTESVRKAVSLNSENKETVNNILLKMQQNFCDAIDGKVNNTLDSSVNTSDKDLIWKTEKKKNMYDKKQSQNSRDLSSSTSGTDLCTTSKADHSCKDLVVPEGWERQVKRITSGISPGNRPGKFDVYYISRKGKKLRTVKEMKNYCLEEGIEVNMSQFSWSHCARIRSTPKTGDGEIPKKKQGRLKGYTKDEKEEESEVKKNGGKYNLIDVAVENTEEEYQNLNNYDSLVVEQATSGDCIPISLDSMALPQLQHKTATVAAKQQLACCSPSVARKRPSNKDLRKHNHPKKARNFQEQSISGSTEKTIKTRSAGSDCGCTQRCFEKVGDKNITAVHDEFWESSCGNNQSAYIQSHATFRTVEHHYNNKKTNKGKSIRVYQVNVGDKVVQVCKKAFASFLGLNQDRIESAMNNMTSSGVPISDRHSNQFRVSHQQLVMDHINSFPGFTNHYSRKSSRNVKYQDTDIKTKKQMWELYKDWLLANYPAQEPVSQHYYEECLRSYSPHDKQSKPQTDTSKTCNLDIIKEIKDS